MYCYAWWYRNKQHICIRRMKWSSGRVKSQHRILTVFGHGPTTGRTYCLLLVWWNLEQGLKVFNAARAADDAEQTLKDGAKGVEFVDE